MVNELDIVSDSEVPTPSKETLSFQDKLDSDKYSTWLENLSDDQLKDEQLRVSKELIQVCSSIMANAGASIFTAPATGFASLAFHGASVSYKQAKRVYYTEHLKICDIELKERGLGSKSISDKEMLKTVGKGVLRTIVPRALFH